MDFLLIAFISLPSRVVINEVMANPMGATGAGKPEDRNEFIELYNMSDETINLAGWRITDFDAIDIIQKWTDTSLLNKYPSVIINSTDLAPHSFALILDPEYTMQNPIGGASAPYEFPPNLLILTIGNTTIGNELQNNDALLLFSPDLAESTSFGTPFDLTDSFPYSAGDGKSWERVFPNGLDLAKNWKVSLDPSGSTPGRENSIISFKDLAIINFYPLPQKSDSSISLSITVYNQGYQDATDWLIRIFNDLNYNQQEELEEGIVTIQGGLLKAQADTNIIFNWSSSPAGSNEIWAVLYYPLDQDTSNNRAMTRITTSSKPIIKFISNRFSPDNDGYEDTLYLHYEVPASGGNLKITVFDLQGNEIVTLIQSRIGNKQGVVYWDGRAKTGKKIAVGIYLIKLEYNLGSNRYEEKKTVVLAKKFRR